MFRVYDFLVFFVYDLGFQVRVYGLGLGFFMVKVLG